MTPPDDDDDGDADDEPDSHPAPAPPPGLPESRITPPDWLHKLWEVVQWSGVNGSTNEWTG